jgi:hypothetical protein
MRRDTRKEKRDLILLMDLLHRIFFASGLALVAMDWKRDSQEVGLAREEEGPGDGSRSGRLSVDLLEAGEGSRFNN